MRVSPELERLILSTPGVIVNGGQAVRTQLSEKQSRSTAEALAKPIRSTRQQTARKARGLVVPGWAVEFVVPCVVVSEANVRGHWTKLHQRHQEQKHAVNVTMQFALAKVQTSQGVPLLVTFTRIGGQRIDEGDNLNISFKYVRDAVFNRIGRNDGDPSIKFAYLQEPSATGPQGVRVRIASQ